MNVHQRVLRRAAFAVFAALIALVPDGRLQASPTTPQIQASYGRLPMIFELNQGQADRAMKFLARGPRYTIGLTPTETLVALHDPASAQAHVIRMAYSGASPSGVLHGVGSTTARVNYYIGQDPARWLENVPTYGKVVQQDIYPGVDLEFDGQQGQLEYDFIVKPGASPGQIRLDFHGVERLEVDRRGNLLLHVAGRVLKMEKPRLYQNADRGRHHVAGGFVVIDDHQVAFRVGEYDVERPLIIDPTFFYSTYLGGSDQDEAFSIAVDPSGNAYVTGVTSSADFPTSDSPHQETNGGGEDVVVTKLNPTGSAIVFSTYLGGSASDRGRGVAVNATGNAYVTGSTESANFPVSAAFQGIFGGVTDAFASKLNANGTLFYSTYLGGESEDRGFAVAVDATGNAYVTGKGTTITTTPGVVGPAVSSGGSAFVNKFDPSGARIYSTYIGNGGADASSAFGIAVDGAGNVYVTGTTASHEFPTTAGAFDTSCGAGPSDTFVTKLNATATAPLVYSTCLGGTLADNVHGLAIDTTGNAYVTGITNSSDFPVFPQQGAFQSNLKGGSDVFVTKLNATGTALAYSTFLGGTEADDGIGITVDGAGNAYVTGLTASHADFPLTGNAIQGTAGSAIDAFLTILNSTGSAPLVYSSYLGGSSTDEGRGVAVDGFSNVYVTGLTFSDNFPHTAGVFQSSHAGAGDAFVTKIMDVAVQPTPQAGKVTGGGTINVPNGSGNFGFIVQRNVASGPIEGKLTYNNQVTGAKVKSTGFTTFTVTNNTASFEGSCTNNGAACTFAVTVEDNGEPGATDEFTISISAGSPEGGILAGGNIQIHD